MRAIAAVVVTLGLIACGTSSAPATTSGIFGNVTAGPTCPVEMEGSPCPPAVWTGQVRATDGSGRTFATRTDERGNFSLSLNPGTYEVVAVSDGGPSFGEPRPIVVVAGPAQRVDLTVDTGIR
jgi:Carboxypeptidase regulatory-like domain